MATMCTCTLSTDCAYCSQARLEVLAGHEEEEEEGCWEEVMPVSAPSAPMPPCTADDDPVWAELIYWYRDQLLSTLERFGAPSMTGRWEHDVQQGGQYWSDLANWARATITTDLVPDSACSYFLGEVDRWQDAHKDNYMHMDATCRSQETVNLIGAYHDAAKDPHRQAQVLTQIRALMHENRIRMKLLWVCGFPLDGTKPVDSCLSVSASAVATAAAFAAA